MKVKYEDLKFMVVIGSFNQDKYEAINIFDYEILKNELNKIAKLRTNKRPTFDEFSERIRKVVMYQFWSRCEYEIIISSWVGRHWENKVDVYDQVRLNWDIFIKMCWEYTTQHWRNK